MGLAYRKRNSKNYVPYTVRIREDILERIREISYKEDLSINEIFNQSLEFALENYKTDNQ